MQAVFANKPDFRLRDVVIETVIRLPKEECEPFLSSLCDAMSFLKNTQSRCIWMKKAVCFTVYW